MRYEWRRCGMSVAPFRFRHGAGVQESVQESQYRADSQRVGLQQQAIDGESRSDPAVSD
jgi:hypothetical protein